jgi:membrane-bound lytic murein transglycosylase D
MEFHPTLPNLKILLITVPLLCWVSCVADTSFLKGPEKRPPDSTIVRESEDRLPRVVPAPVPASPKEVEQARPCPARTEPPKDKQDASLPERGYKSSRAYSDSIAKPATVDASPKTENTKKEEYPTLKRERERIALAPTDVVEELTIVSSPPISRQEDVSSCIRLEEKSGRQKSPLAEESTEGPRPGMKEQRGSSSEADRREEKERLSIPPEIEEPHELVMLTQSDDEKPISIPLWLEQGKPVPSSEEAEEAQQIASIPKGTSARTLSSPEGGEEEQRMPVDAERSEPLKKETQKQLAQGMLDSALEFCQASNDFWEQGDLYNAIDALDQAYSLILRVSPKDDSELLQQKDDLRFTISKRIIEVYSSRITVANGRNSVIPLAMNNHVEGALNLFKGKERRFFLGSYKRSGKYRPAILRALKEEGLPEELSWLPLIESGFKVKAFSRSRALGLWQFIASTGYKFGLKRDRWVDERMDPEKSTQAAILYLKELHQIFGDWTTALAAYNCGEGRVLKCIQTQKINYLDNFWDLYERLPMETAFYVPKFLAVLHILKDPEAHGFTLPSVDEEVEIEAVTIDKQAHLNTIAKHTGVPYDLLAEINPSLRHDFTPDRPFSFKMPKGKGQVLLSKLADIPVWHPPTPAYVVHKVRSGESLSVIARRYGTRVSSIMRLNNLRSSHFIRAGWSLKIPKGMKYPILSAVSSEASGSPGREELVRYVVQKGDSLWRIAERFGTTTNAIQSVNQLRDTRLSVGQVLMIPQELAATEVIATKTYIVSKGDSPYLIATRNRMKLSEFLRINNLSPRSTIFPGQALLVKAE